MLSPSSPSGSLHPSLRYASGGSSPHEQFPCLRGTRKGEAAEVLESGVLEEGKRTSRTSCSLRASNVYLNAERSTGQRSAGAQPAVTRRSQSGSPGLSHLGDRHAHAHRVQEPRRHGLPLAAIEKAVADARPVRPQPRTRSWSRQPRRSRRYNGHEPHGAPTRPVRLSAGCYRRLPEAAPRQRQRALPSRVGARRQFALERAPLGRRQELAERSPFRRQAHPVRGEGVGPCVERRRRRRAGASGDQAGRGQQRGASARGHRCAASCLSPPAHHLVGEALELERERVPEGHLPLRHHQHRDAAARRDPPLRAGDAPATSPTCAAGLFATGDTATAPASPWPRLVLTPVSRNCTQTLAGWFCIISSIAPGFSSVGLPGAGCVRGSPRRVGFDIQPAATRQARMGCR